MTVSVSEEARRATELEQAFAALAEQFQAMPAIATDGGTAKLMKLPGTSPALELAARRLADAFRTSAENEAVSLPPLFWSLPVHFREDVGWRVIAIVEPPLSECTIARVGGACGIGMGQWWLGFARTWIPGSPLAVEICFSRLVSVSVSSLCKTRQVQGRRPKTCGPRPSIVASAGCTARAGQELSASLVLRRRPPRGIYRTFIVAADATGTRTVLAVRPFVVSPKKAKPTRGRPMPARAAR